VGEELLGFQNRAASLRRAASAGVFAARALAGRVREPMSEPERCVLLGVGHPPAPVAGQEPSLPVPRGTWPLCLASFPLARLMPS